jgi:excisionase family DNA binding protein
MKAVERTYFSISEAARLLGVSRPTIYARIRSGELLAVKVSPRTLRIPIEEIKAQPIRYAPAPSSIRDIRRALETMITRDEAIAKYGISQQWFYKKVRAAGIKAMRYGTKAYYRKDAIHRLFFKRKYPEITDWTTSEELAKEFGIGRKTICTLARKFDIPRVRTKRNLLISRKDWLFHRMEMPDLQKNYLTVSQAIKLYHIGLTTFYNGVNTNNVTRRRQGREVYFPKADLDRLFKDRSPKIPEEIRRDYVTAGDALKVYHVAQKRFSAETRAKGVTKVRTEGNFVWYKKTELDELFKR